MPYSFFVSSPSLKTTIRDVFYRVIKASITFLDKNASWVGISLRYTSWW